MEVMDKIRKFFSQTRCWRCGFKHDKSEMMLFFGKYACKNCYKQLRRQLVNIYVKKQKEVF